MAGLIVAALAAVISFTLARHFQSRNSKLHEDLAQLAQEDYHQQPGP